ncbi:MAG: glycoside hydrolase family 127 protein [Treponema sp.]|jgi:DUF1680 family protein|nr:glycoside hydrolase family 127 protein [Treponema sp.]
MKANGFIGGIAAALALAGCASSAGSGSGAPPAQALLFPLRDVRLLEGPLKAAQDLNTRTLLAYDVDRLLAPYLKEAGLEAKAPSFPAWAGLDGHVGGHYLSALALTGAATGDERIKARMDYMIAELRRCHDKNGSGYVGGVPNGAALWDEMRRGSIAGLGKYWVPWYNLHKMYAGLRDAYVYAGSEDAKRLFLDFCDWGLRIIRGLDAAAMEAMLDTEFGGMNEVYADAYALSGDKKYLAAAKRFSHNTLFLSMAGRSDNLDNLHANTQVPKAVGYARVAALTQERAFGRAAAFFWDTVVKNRTLALGGNGRSEYFRPMGKDYAEDVQGPETCATYNMMKLTEALFCMSPDAAYADYYERAMYNHILSSQNPVTGGYVYFTPARPAHYRVYSEVNEAMWCCVGTGMENHGRYGAFIYAHTQDALYVNLYAASELHWAEKGLRLRQETAFPDEEQSTIRIQVDSPVRFTLLIRRPWWSSRQAVTLNNDDENYAAGAKMSSYIAIDRVWQDGDTVRVSLPMGMTVEVMPKAEQYAAIMRGPILMAARIPTEDGLDFFADDGRWAHIPGGRKLPPGSAPALAGRREEILEKLQHLPAVDGAPLRYRLTALVSGGHAGLVLEPFFRIHESRYMMYWPMQGSPPGQ